MHVEIAGVDTSEVIEAESGVSILDTLATVESSTIPLHRLAASIAFSSIGTHYPRMPVSLGHEMSSRAGLFAVSPYLDHNGDIPECCRCVDSIRLLETQFLDRSHNGPTT